MLSASRRKMQQPRSMGGRKVTGKREQRRVIRRRKKADDVRAVPSARKRVNPKVTFGEVKTKLITPKRVVEPFQPDPDKGPVQMISPLSEKNLKTGEYPTGFTEDDESQEFVNLEPVALNLSLYSYAEMKRLKVVTVTETTNENNPVRDSANDPKLGPYNPLAECEYCDEKDCPGHYGLIKLPKQWPVPNPLLLDYISRVLSCVCNSCAKLLVSKELLESQGYLLLKGFDRFTAVTNMCENVTCSRRKKVKTSASKGKKKGDIETGATKTCSANPVFFPGNSLKYGWIAYRMSKKDKDKENMMDPKKVFDILDNISDEDAELMGFDPPNSHPRDMVLRGILVIPTSARPPHIKNSKTLCDQLTETYNKIVRAKNSLINAKNAGGKCECYKTMVTAIRELMKASNTKQMHGRTPMPIAARLQGKNGIFRRFLMGKRTDHCARTVLGPDTDVRFGQIRIPKFIADQLVKRVKVFEYNKYAVEEMVRQGKVLNITDKNGVKRKYAPNREYKIEIGTIVERKLQNGDRIVFNRQPTLHKYSLMSYEVVIGKQHTIGLHLSVTPPHNADQLKIVAILK